LPDESAPRFPVYRSRPGESADPGALASAGILSREALTALWVSLGGLAILGSIVYRLYGRFWIPVP
jgi:hypothetical protein